MGKQINVRFNDVEIAKLKKIEEETRMTKSEIIRRLLNDGQINMLYNQKEVVRYMTGIHKDFNAYSNMIGEKQKNIEKAAHQVQELVVSNNGIVTKEMETIITFISNQLMIDYQNERAKKEQELRECVNIQSNK